VACCDCAGVCGGVGADEMVGHVKMTYALAVAAAQDAAITRMRKAGRTSWDAEDFDTFVVTFHKLWPCPKGVECDICYPKERVM
jgi:hypothetical protein